MRGIIKKILRESDFEWMEDITPLEDQHPKDWVGLTFGYGHTIYDTFPPDNPNKDETWTIVSLTDKGDLKVRRNDPSGYGEHEQYTVVTRNQILNHINKGEWVWV